METEKDMTPILLEDLGMVYATPKGKNPTRFGIYSCVYCGNNFKARCSHIKDGSIRSCGCQKGLRKITHSHFNKIKDKESFIKKAIEKYGGKFLYDSIKYSKLNDIVENIYCKEHNHYFNINGNSFIHNAKIGCPLCIQDKIKDTQRIPQDEIIKRLYEKHGIDKFDFTKSIYEGNDKTIEVKCNTCDTIFYPIVNNILSGTGCPHCAELSKEHRWKDAPTTFYIIKFIHKNKVLYKIGITTRDIQTRYKFDFKGVYEVVYEKSFSDGKEPFTLEQKLRGKIYKYNFKGESPFILTGTNEIFEINPLPYLYNLISKTKAKNN